MSAPALAALVVVLGTAAITGCSTDDAETATEADAASTTTAAPTATAAPTTTVAPTTEPPPPPTPAPTPAPTQPPTTAAPAPASEPAAALMPDVVCTNLQDAQDRIQETGVFYSRSYDATGEGRSQIVDSNWVVVEQSPPPGTPIGEGDANLGAVKYGESLAC